MPKPHAFTVSLLVIAVLASAAFGNGEHAHPLLAWAAPLLMLRLVRSCRSTRALLGAWLVAAIAWTFQWHGVFRAEGAELAAGALLFGGVSLLPYLADRACARHLAPLPATLVFPCALVAQELMLARTSPFGAWGMLAYTQADVLPLAQLAALTGMWGVTFLVAWFASVANAVWASPARRGAWSGATIAFAATLAAVAAFGVVRLAASTVAAAGGTRIAIVLPHHENNRNYDAELAPELIAGLLRETERAARNGAQLVVWPEDSFFVTADEARALHARVATLARTLGVHLGIAYGERERRGTLHYRNVSMLFGADGGVLWRYSKSHAVPGYEQRYMIEGDHRIASAQTPLGRLAGAICFDADHAEMTAQLGGSHDALLLPSDDWPAIDWLHAAMVRVRAIEQGVPVVRPTINGRSVAYDARGRLVAALPSGSAGRTLHATLLFGAVPTPYVAIGDAFAWACGGGLILLGAAARIRARGQRRSGVAPSTDSSAFVPGP